MELRTFLLLPLFFAASLSANSSRNIHPPYCVVTYNKPTTLNLQKNDLVPRLEWDQNFGYCGETSFITAGLYYGQYCSQYTARALTSPGVPQYEDGSQLLIGVNDQDAAAAMRLSVIEWDSISETDTDDFLAWIKQFVLAGNPVIIGVFNNEYLLYGDTDPDAGDETYDHIVLAYGIGSNQPLADTSFYPDDILYIIDNGLWGAFRNPPYYFSYQFSPFESDREDANSPNGPIYSLNDDARNFGVAMTGVMDLNNDTIPVRVETNVNYEIPEILQGQDVDNPPPGANAPPPPIPLTLTVTVSIPDQTMDYNLYYYNDFAKVPTSHFNTNRGNAYKTYLIPHNSGSTYVLSIDILSNEVAAFRAVSTSAD